MATANMVLTSFLVGLLLIPQFYCSVQSDYDGGRVERLIEDDKVVRDLFYQTASCGTEHGRELNDANFFATNNGIRHTPTVSGFMATQSTFRYLSLHQQTAVMVGESKHGVWRIQENGFVRVYREQGKEGIQPNQSDEVTNKENKLPPDDTNAEKINRLLDILEENYKNISPNNTKANFKYSFGNRSVVENGTEVLNWIDLPIFHVKFKASNYADHVPIDLPGFYCTLSGSNFPHVGITWNVITAQLKRPGGSANIIGPLGKRAGLDIQENYNYVVRFHQFSGAGIWANIGQGNATTDKMPQTKEELEDENRAQTLNWTRIDLEKMNVDSYVVERSFHNATESESFLHLIFVMDDPNNKTAFSYVRPHGIYYDYLKKNEREIINTEPNYYPEVPIEKSEGTKPVYGAAFWAPSGMNMVRFNLGGGGCPTKGGDYGTYPWGDCGSAWSTNYEEIVPLCDAFLFDIKMSGNVGAPWDDDRVGLGNAGVEYKDEITVKFQAQENFYGKYTDPYNVEHKKKNPYELDFTGEREIKQEPKEESYIPVADFFVNFGKTGKDTRPTLKKFNASARGCLASHLPQGEPVIGGNLDIEKQAQENASARGCLASHLPQGEPVIGGNLDIEKQAQENAGTWNIGGGDHTVLILVVIVSIQALVLLSLGVWAGVWIISARSRRAARVDLPAAPPEGDVEMQDMGGIEEAE